MSRQTGAGTVAGIALVLLAVAASSVYKTKAFSALPQYDPGSDRLLFWTEGAFHYRYARMVAEGGTVPDFDRPIQMPEGLEVRTQITIFMEVVAGRLFRALRSVGVVHAPFHVFLVHFVCWFSSLSIVAVALAAAAVWQNRGAVVVATLAYTLSPMSTNRTIGNYGREDFALPLLFLFLAFFLRSLRSSRSPWHRVDANLAGLFLATALASWHLSRFFLLVFVSALPVLVLTQSDRRALRGSLSVVTGWALLASFLVPVLAEKRFVLSVPMSVLYSAVLVLFLAERRAWAPRATSGGIVLLSLLLILGIGFVDGREDYSHVYSLVHAKILHLGKKPADPSALPFEARVLWVTPFTTPGPYYLVTQGGVVLLWGLAALVSMGYQACRRRLSGSVPLVAYLLLIYGTLFVLIGRLSSVLVFFLALAIPVLLRIRRPGRIVVPLLVVSLTWQVWRDLAGSTRSLGPLAPHVRALRRSEPWPNLGNDRRLLEWVRATTEPDAVFLTWYSTGPMLLAYGDRPIVLHSKWESTHIRNKFRRTLEGLFGKEEEMIRVCEEFRADYVVAQINFALDDSYDSPRYQAGLRSLPAESTAALMHFRPDSLRRFTLVYQDSYYRVFRFHPDTEPVPPANRLPREEVWVDVRTAAGDTADDVVARRAQTLLATRHRLTREAQIRFASGDWDGAGGAIARLLRFSPDSEEGLLLLSEIQRARGNLEGALAAVQRGLETRPESAELRFALGETRRAMKLESLAMRAYESALETHPDHPGARARLATLRGP